MVELGYISTPDEEQYLLSDAGTTALSNSIYKAFLNYKREHDAPNRPQQSTRTRITGTRKQTERIRIEIQTAEPDTATETGQGYQKALVPATPKKRSQATKPEHLPSLYFKIQILVSNKILPKGSKQLKGVSPVSYYREKGLYKYTYGEKYGL